MDSIIFLDQYLALIVGFFREELWRQPPLLENTPNYSENRLLRVLPPDVSETFGQQLELLDMEVRHRVFEPDRPSQHVYFPLSAVISVLAKMQDGVAVEIATVGREGMVGLEIFLGGEQMPASAFCQIPFSITR